MAVVYLGSDSNPALTNIAENQSAISIEVLGSWVKGIGYAFNFGGGIGTVTFNACGERDTSDPYTSTQVASTLC